MKTQTAEEFLKDKDAVDSLWTESDEDICKAFNEFTTTQIEALRERLMKNATSVLSGVSIEQTINTFLKEIND
jgi:hypothetical protein